jgi:hypothetical protein
MKLLIYGNLLPIHNPLRLAEELSMLDCLSNGRLISGFARGIPREYVAYGVDLSESRARFEEAWEIIKRAWTEEAFSYQGKFWSYKDVAILMSSARCSRATARNRITTTSGPNIERASCAAYKGSGVRLWWIWSVANGWRGAHQNRCATA